MWSAAPYPRAVSSIRSPQAEALANGESSLYYADPPPGVHSNLTRIQPLSTSSMRIDVRWLSAITSPALLRPVLEHVLNRGQGALADASRNRCGLGAQAITSAVSFEAR